MDRPVKCAEVLGPFERRQNAVQNGFEPSIRGALACSGSVAREVAKGIGYAVEVVEVVAAGVQRFL